MNLIKFVENFPDEASCKLKFKEMRDKEGVVCRKCDGTNHYWISTLEQYQCKTCKTRTTLRSGTVMQGSNLTFRYWILAIHLMTSTKKGFSALELQKQIGHKFYEPIWYMVKKLRKTMGHRDGQYQLDKIVELDEGFFESVDTEKSKEEKQNEEKKRGRGSQKQSTVMVMASTVHDFSTKKQYKKSTKFRYVKMVIMNNMKSETVKEIVQDNIDYNSVVNTDKYTSYSKIKDQVWSHKAQKVPANEVEKVLPWVHTMISNAKRTLLGVHHMISIKYMQDYLDEFCYKANQRYFGENLFDILLIACVNDNYKVNINDS